MHVHDGYIRAHSCPVVVLVAAVRTCNGAQGDASLLWGQVTDLVDQAADGHLQASDVDGGRHIHTAVAGGGGAGGTSQHQAVNNRVAKPVCCLWVQSHTLKNSHTVGASANAPCLLPCSHTAPPPHPPKSNHPPPTRQPPTFSRSRRSCSTSAGCPLSTDAYLVHSASYACRSPVLNTSNISCSHW